MRIDKEAFVNKLFYNINNGFTKEELCAIYEVLINIECESGEELLLDEKEILSDYKKLTFDEVREMYELKDFDNEKFIDELSVRTNFILLDDEKMIVNVCQALCHLQTKTSHSYKKYIIEGKEYTHCKLCGKQKIKQRRSI